jgi:hypothetical protein
MMVVAAALGLRFNAAKCSSLTISKDKADPDASLHIRGVPIRSMAAGEHEDYLGVPIGTRLTFRPASSLPGKLTLLADSDLAPWQKLEVFCAHLLTSLSHHLATGRVQRGFLDEVDLRCAEFLRHIANVPHTAHSAFLFADRRAGGLGASQLKQDADIWTIARANQLLDSQDLVVRLSVRSQLEQHVLKGLGSSYVDHPPLSNFLSGSTRGGLSDSRFYKCGPNTWSRSRKAARRLNVKIDVSGDGSTKVVADDISCVSS